MIQAKVLNDIRHYFDLDKKNEVGIMERANLFHNKDFNRYKGNIDWSTKDNVEILMWNDFYSDELIKRLSKSVLSNYKYLMLQVGYDEAVYSVPFIVFVNHWEEILFASVEGFPLMTPDKKYFLEFLNFPKVVYSNFHI